MKKENILNQENIMVLAKQQYQLFQKLQLNVSTVTFPPR